MANNLFKLLRKSYYFYCVTVFFLLSCDNSIAAEKQNLKKTVSYPTFNSPETMNSLTVPKLEYETAQFLHGFIWEPFILPIENLTITNASLYVGYWKNNPEEQSMDTHSKKIFPPPKEGECILLETEIQKTPKSEKTLYRFVNANKEKTMNTALFFIINADHKPIAVARLNANGESRCALSSQPYSLSMGFGRQRNEVKIAPNLQIININFTKTARLRINPVAGNNLQNGDMIRIGRKIDFNFAKKYHEFESIIIPIRIYSDLYHRADMASRDLAIDEYLKTSFLVGLSRYQIELEPGQYVVAVLRKNKLVCFDNFTLKSNASYELSCINALKNAKKSREEVAYQFEFEDTIFDVGFRPNNLINDKNFVNWTINTPGTILLGAPMNPGNEKPKNTNSDLFSIVFKNKSGQAVQTNYGASLPESIKTFKIPLKGMTKQNFLEGQAPFSEYILAKSQKYSTPYFLDHTNTMHTNGAEISILEPTMTNTGNLFATNEQKFFIRITVPKYNATKILEMFINGKLTKRWILNRGNVLDPFSSTESMITYEDKNFKVKFVARGESALSNFLTGRDAFLPFAETREFCVSIDGKENCS